jgi:GDPmannose 4,6-dehydratase
MYGDFLRGPLDEPLDEKNPLNPNSPYAIAKTAAHQYCKMKRAQGRFISCGILFNHESEIRGGDFVTQKIARGVWRWQREAVPIHLGNLNARRDWGYAGDYVKAMHLMLQHDQPDDFVIATSETHSIREFVELAFKQIGVNVHWTGEGIEEQGHADSYTPVVVVDKAFYRPNDVNYLIGDYSKAKELLGWQPEHKFDLVVKIMVDAAKEAK